MSSATKFTRSRAAVTSAAPAAAALKPRRLGAALFALVIAAILLAAWVHRGDNWISPQTGLGYQLGIIGSLMMLALLLYPQRKRYANLEWLGQIGDLFRIHMVLGIVGPLLVVLHCNFQLGSINSNVALGAMLVVVASGIVGRYLYGHIHVGLYGRKAELKDLVHDADALKEIVGQDGDAAPILTAALSQFEAESLKAANPLNALRYGAATRQGRKALSQILLPLIERQAAAGRWPQSLKLARRDAALLHLEQYLAAIRKAAAFAVYERLFAIWHVLHMPMFFLLVFAAIAHVVAVHLY
jgi:hypothetical protein